MNSKNVSPTILSNPSSIFEGDQFTLAFYKGINAKGLKEYQCFGAQSGSLTETTLAGIPNVIIVNGFGDKQITDVNIDNDLFTLTANKGGFVSGTKTKLGYNNNSIFGNNIRLLPNEFGLKVELSVQNDAIGKKEVVELAVNTSLNQRYKVQAKGNYGKYSTIYLGNENEYQLTNLFEIYDLKLGATTDKLTVANTSDINNYLTGISGNLLTFSGAESFNNKISETKATEFNFNLSGGELGTSVSHKYGFNIALTPKYYAVEMKDADQNYGIVVDGSADSSYSSKDWKDSIIYLDYYGDVVEGGTLPDNSYSIYSGIGNLSAGTLSGLSADNSVTITVKSDSVEIGQVKVTMRRYYGLKGGSVDVTLATGTNKLDFADWTKEIKALVVGKGESQNGEDLGKGLGLFTYSVGAGYDILYEDGQYKLVNTNGNFEAVTSVVVTVNYMGKELRKITVNITNN